MHGHFIYLLWYTHVRDGQEASKFLGVFSSNALAQDAIVHYRTVQGFRENPNGFMVVKHEIDKRMMTEGFE